MTDAPDAHAGELRVPTSRQMAIAGAAVIGEPERPGTGLPKAWTSPQVALLLCRIKSPGAIYCEAQSADSWPVLASVFSSERVARLHSAGYSDPGRAPNYWRNYAINQIDDEKIAREPLTILYDVYGYNGSPKLAFVTEKGRR